MDEATGRTVERSQPVLLYVENFLGFAPGTGMPSGTITIKDGTTVLGTATIVNGVAVFKTAKLSKGKHNLTADFSGDISFSASTSTTLLESIN